MASGLVFVTMYFRVCVSRDFFVIFVPKRKTLNGMRGSLSDHAPFKGKNVGSTQTCNILDPAF